MQQCPGGYGTCSREFRVGERYLVYAFEGDSELESNTCKRTVAVSEAAEDLKALGKGKVIRKVAARRGAPQPNNGMHPTADTTLVMLCQTRGAAGDAWR